MNNHDVSEPDRDERLGDIDLPEGEQADVKGGAKAIEYGLISAGISVAVISGTQAGGNLAKAKQDVSTKLNQR